MARKKEKKISAKKEKYSKFGTKEKPGTLDLKFPEPSEDAVVQRKEDEGFYEKFFRFSKNPRTKEVSARKMASKR